MGDMMTIPERREMYRQRMAESKRQNEAKIETFMEVVLAEAWRRYPDVKMKWRERENQAGLLPWQQPELIFTARLKNKDWYFAVKERDLFIADDYDKFLAYNIHLLIAMMERHLE